MCIPREHVEVKQRCYRCFRPSSRCFCEYIPRIDNRTPILILQHVGERFHAFNTARIVKAALRRCDLVVDHNRRFENRHLSIQSQAGLLYPQPGAPILSELAVTDRPNQLIIVDGTWPQAKTILRDVPQIQNLPRRRAGIYRLLAYPGTPAHAYRWTCLIPTAP